ncbi:MAG: hypothetical protein ACM3YM_03150 [Sphingomonadales bacterium]
MRVAFEPPAGIASNDTIYASPGAWADVSNLRFVDGRPQTIGGWSAMFAPALTGLCRNVFNWTNLTGVQNVAFGTHTALQVYLAGVLATITPSGLVAGSADNVAGGAGYGVGPYGIGSFSVPAAVFRLRTWSLDSWGQTLLAAPRFGTLYQWANDTGVAAAAVANAPAAMAAMLVTPERQVLALGCSEEVSGDYNPLCIRGCDIENLTVWATASDNNGFEHVLEGGGQIVAGRMVGPVVGVWTDNALHQGTFLGNPDQTYQFDVVDENCGAVGPNAVCTLRGAAYWIGKDMQIRAWSYGTNPQIIPCPIWKEFADNVVAAQADKIVAVSNSRFDEIWFFYPDSRDGSENSRYIAFAIAADGPKWSRGQIARSASCDAGVLTYPVGVSPAGAVYNHETGSTADGASLDWSARSAAQYLGEGETVLQVQRVRPDFKGQQAAIALTAFARAHPQAAPVIKGPFAIAPGAAKIDLRFSGAIVELQFSGTNYVRFGKPTFDAVPLGRR